MAGLYGQADEAESIRTLRKAAEMGCNFWDTSDAYGPYSNERLLSRVLAEDRHGIFIATKFGVRIDPHTLQRSVDCSATNVLRSCDASLQRLGVDTIDLYYPHRVDPSVPIEETVAAMADLVKQGKVRYVGLSEPGPDTIRRAHRVLPISAVQVEYSLWSRGAETEILPVLRDLGIALVAYAPLGRGFLTGSIRRRSDLAEGDFRRSQPRFADDNLGRNLHIVKCIEELAAEKGITPAQFALAWVLNQGTDIVPIVGTRRASHLEENLAAAHIQLSRSELDRLNQVLPEPVGDRYDAAGMRSVGI